MLFQKSSWIIVAGGIAILLLILFQINWLQHSRRLIEEQFDQKVTMALCSAVEEVSRQDQEHAPACTQSNTDCDPNLIAGNIDSQELEAALRRAMTRYAIDLDYAFDIISVEPPPLLQRTAYCSPINPMAQNERSLKVEFSGKERYIIQKMGLMASSSILIVLLIIVLFATVLVKLIQLRSLHHQSTNFFNNMAHEFRTPLTNIGLALSLWKKKEKTASAERYFSVIESESKRLQHQVGRILQVAQLDQGSYPLEQSTFDFVKLLEEVQTEMQMSVQHKSGKLQLTLPEEANLLVKGDRLHLGNLLRNLIENAIKYCEQNPQIHLELCRKDEHLHLLIHDNGTGIPESKWSEIFQPFQRAVGGNIHQQKGFGLGLSYARQIAERHQGSLRLVSSTSKGSQFLLVLPLKSETYATA